MPKPRTDLTDEPQTLAPLAERFGAELQRQISVLLEQAGIELAFPLTYRVKACTPPAESLERQPDRATASPEAHGLVAIRLVVLFQQDARRFCEVLQRYFKISPLAAESPEEDENAPLFAGLLELPEGWKTLPSFAAAGDLRAQIQVRTLPQHLYALLTERLESGPNAPLTAPLKRSLHRLAALLETVDLELDRLVPETGSQSSAAVLVSRHNATAPVRPSEDPRGGATAAPSPEVEIIVESPAQQKARSEKEAEEEQTAMRLFDSIHGTKDKARRNQMLAELKATHEADEDNAVVRRLYGKALFGLYCETNGETDPTRREPWLSEMRSLYRATPDDATIRSLFAKGLAHSLNLVSGSTHRNQVVAELKAICEAYPDDTVVRKLLYKA